MSPLLAYILGGIIMRESWDEFSGEYPAASYNQGESFFLAFLGSQDSLVVASSQEEWRVFFSEEDEKSSHLIFLVLIIFWEENETGGRVCLLSYVSHLMLIILFSALSFSLDILMNNVKKTSRDEMRGKDNHKKLSVLCKKFLIFLLFLRWQASLWIIHSCLWRDLWPDVTQPWRVYNIRGSKCTSNSHMHLLLLECTKKKGGCSFLSNVFS